MTDRSIYPNECDQCAELTGAYSTLSYHEMQECGRRAVASCQQTGCEKPLCAIHADFCGACKAWFCEGCMAEHECVPERPTLVERVSRLLAHS